MNIMTKRGSQDNVATYEHLCDTTADLQNIDPRYITLGSIAIILQGTSGGLEIYIADSNKQWNSLTTISGGISGSDFSPDISNPQDGDTLVYDGTAGKWVNGVASGEIYYITLTYDESTDTETLNSTWQEIHDAMAARKLCVLFTDTNQSVYMQYITTVQQEAVDKFAVYCNGDEEYVFYTSTANGYPSYTLT